MIRRFFRNSKGIALLLAFFLLAAGCEDKRGVRIGDSAPAIVGTDLRGNSIGPESLKGKTVVVYFWTDSCCGDSLKLLEPFYRRNKSRNLELVAVNEIDTREKIESYVALNGVTFSMLADERSMLFKQYNVVGFPTVLVLDKDGVIREKVLGDMPTAKLEKLIETHLN